MNNSFLDRRTRAIRQGSGPNLPLDYQSLKREAADTLPEEVYDYVAGGAGREDTIRADRRAIDRYRIVPRVLCDVAERDLSTTFLGRNLPAPLAIAPVGGQSIYHEEGELASARAAADLGIPFSVSTMSSRSIESVAEAMENVRTDAPRLFQLYWMPDWEITASMVDRAEAAGYDAIVVTLDVQIDRWDRRNLENAYSIAHVAKENLRCDPLLQARAEEQGVPIDNVLSDDVIQRDASLTWEDLAWLREQTDLPIVLKGIMHPDDARLAVEHDADGIVVSSHGGRAVDGAQGALSALPNVVNAVDGDIPILFDSGIRTGADAFKALALGADTVMLGRPFIFALAIAGQQGVAEITTNVLAELDSVVGLSGHADVEEISRDALVEE